jgi:colanic acid biosynthesis glycosyl transferase WcaI
VSRILVWSPNYAPELTGIPPLVTDACEWLAARGHEVDVVTALPNYPERRIHSDYRGKVWCSEERGGVAVHRSWLRVRPAESFRDKVLYEASFAAFSLSAVVRRLRQVDVLVCVVPSLLAAALAGLLPRRPRVVLWVQDLVLAAALSVDGVGTVAGRALTVARRLERFAMRRSDRVVSCSPGFVGHLEGLGVAAEKISVVLNWVDTDWIAPMPLRPNGRTRFLYAGNFGYTQGFETLFDAVRSGPDEIEVELVGEGNACERVRSLAASSPRSNMRAPVAQNAYPGLLAEADAHLVLQRGVSAGANLPSKIASYLASGRPIVASIEPSSPAGVLLRASGGALVVRPDDPGALAQAMRRVHESPELRAELGAHGRDYAVRALSKTALLPQLEEDLLGV